MRLNLNAKLVILIIAFCSLCVSCDRVSNKNDAQLSKRVAELENQVTIQEKTIAEVDNKLSKASTGVVGLIYQNWLDQEALKWATFTPASKDFQPIKTSLGIFYIALMDITKYANGYKVRFKVGNPYSITYSNLYVKIAYGSEKPFVTSTKQHELTLPQLILPSSWNNISIILAMKVITSIDKI